MKRSPRRPAWACLHRPDRRSPSVVARTCACRVLPRDEPREIRRRAATRSTSRGRRRDARSAIRCACRNIRFSPCFASTLFHAKSPYLSSPASGKPRCVRCTRIWCVRPVSSSASSSASGGSCAWPRRRRGGRSCCATRPSRSTRTRRSPSPVTKRLERQLDRGASRRASCRAPARDSACRPRPRAAARAARSAPRASWRPAARPTCRGRADARARGISRRAARARSRSIDAERDAAAAVDRESGRLVERDQRVVLVQDRRHRDAPRGRVGRRGRADGAAVRIGGIRSSIARRARRASGPTRPPVDPDLAAAQDPVDVALRDAFQDLRQEIVDALAVRRPRRPSSQFTASLLKSFICL